MIEDERTFLIATMPDLSGCERAAIEQHYLSDRKKAVRARSIIGRADGDRYELAKKKDLDPAFPGRKIEQMIEITAEDFRDQIRLSKRHLTKTRHWIPLTDGLVAEVDVFSGPLTGLVWVEVEFPSEAVRDAFVPPPWFGREITDEKWASCSYMAGRSYKDIKHLL